MTLVKGWDVSEVMSEVTTTWRHDRISVSRAFVTSLIPTVMCEVIGGEDKGWLRDSVLDLSISACFWSDDSELVAMRAFFRAFLAN